MDPRPQECLLSHLTLDDPLKDSVDLVVNRVDIPARLDSSQEVGVGRFVSELSEPLLQATPGLIEGDPSVDEAGHALTLVIDRLDDLAKR